MDNVIALPGDAASNYQKNIMLGRLGQRIAWGILAREKYTVHESHQELSRYALDDGFIFKMVDGKAKEFWVQVKAQRVYFADKAPYFVGSTGVDDRKLMGYENLVRDTGRQMIMFFVDGTLQRAYWTTLDRMMAGDFFPRVEKGRTKYSRFPQPDLKFTGPRTDPEPQQLWPVPWLLKQNQATISPEQSAELLSLSTSRSPKGEETIRNAPEIAKEFWRRHELWERSITIQMSLL